MDGDLFLRRACGFILIYVVFGCMLPITAIAIQSLHERHQQNRQHAVPATIYRAAPSMSKEQSREAGAVVMTPRDIIAGCGPIPSP